jgi:two-component system, OmpR family, sensor histidine kinase TctE
MLNRPDQRSLFGEILDWMLVPLVVLWPLSLALTWAVAQNIASRPFDRELGDRVRMVARQLQVQPPPAEGMAPVVRMPPVALDELMRVAAEDEDTMHFLVLGARGEWVGGDPTMDVPERDAATPRGQLLFRDEVFRDRAVRTAWLWLPLPNTLGDEQSIDKLALVQIAETLDKRERLATEIIKGVILPQFAILPLAVALIWLALAKGFRPLNELQRRIRRRDSGDLSPIDEGAVPEEVAPLVRSINDLLQRLDQSMGAQRHFLADAAHQLKTPLAGLRMQAELAQRAFAAGQIDASGLQASLRQIAHSSQQATHTVNQLLAMARADAQALLTQQAFDLVAVAQEAVRDFVPQALAKGIDLGYEGPAAQAPLQLVGHPLLVREALRNLIDNAIVYTPSGGIVTVRLAPEPFGQAVLLEVEDSGPGIAAEERERIFQPFYRTLGTGVEGTGLGLAIVREVAQRHGGTVSVQEARPADAAVPGAGPGARFVLRFPLRRAGEGSMAAKASA